jgi:hypothetical protein
MDASEDATRYLLFRLLVPLRLEFLLSPLFIIYKSPVGIPDRVELPLGVVKLRLKLKFPRLGGPKSAFKVVLEEEVGPSDRRWGLDWMMERCSKSAGSFTSEVRGEEKWPDSLPDDGSSRPAAEDVRLLPSGIREDGVAGILDVDAIGERMCDLQSRYMARDEQAERVHTGRQVARDRRSMRAS